MFFVFGSFLFCAFNQIVWEYMYLRTVIRSFITRPYIKPLKFNHTETVTTFLY